MKKTPSRSGSLFQQLGKLPTEKRNPRSRNIDRQGVETVLRIINREDGRVAHAVKKEIPRIAKAVRMVSDLERMGGNVTTVAVTDGIDEALLLTPPEFEGAFDPHVWFDVTLWMKAVETVRDTFAEVDPGSGSPAG